MKLTIELSAADIDNGKFVELYEMFARQSSPPSQAFCHSDPVEPEHAVEPQPIHDPKRSIGLYEKPDADDPPKPNDLVISMGEGLMKELVDLWDEPETRAEELRLIGSKIHSCQSFLAFIRHMTSLSHAIHHVRVRDGSDDTDWERSEEIALNMTNIASLVFHDVVALYSEKFSWEHGDPNYLAYRRAIENV